MVTDLDVAAKAARQAGADVLVAPFPDPIGRDAVIQCPGGVNMQLYWHTTRPAHAPFATVPESRAYVSADRVKSCASSFLAFSHGKAVSDVAGAAGEEIGRPGESYRRIRIESAFGRMLVMVTDGHLPYPYGKEQTGYEVADLEGTLAKARAAGVQVVRAPETEGDRSPAIVEFPGGYLAEVHSVAAH
jgi:predicted enzyme related to lactoylglutathione lyase